LESYELGKIIAELYNLEEMLGLTPPFAVEHLPCLDLMIDPKSIVS
jgi:hypothetical protein